MTEKVQLEVKNISKYFIKGDNLFSNITRSLGVGKNIEKVIALDNVSLTIKEREIVETKILLNENKFQLTDAQFKKIEKNNYYRQFINFKLYGNYKDSISFLLNPKNNLFNLKNFAILFIPTIILKRLLWFQ